MDNVLKRAAAELKEAGCRVFAWQDDTYNRGWSKGDYIMLYYAFPDSLWKWIGVLCQGGSYVRSCDGVRRAERAVT